MPKRKATAASLHVQSKKETKKLDSILTNGHATIIVVVVDWCGACKRVKPMWLNALKKQNKKNLVVIENELLPETSMNLDISHFPSTFEIPPGGTPTLLSNPQDIEEINTTLNSGPNSGPNSVQLNSGPSLSSPEVTASEYVNSRIPTPTVVHSNRPVNRTRSFTPSLEKLKGGRRKRRTRRYKS
jgi:hypothetical protein